VGCSIHLERIQQINSIHSELERGLMIRAVKGIDMGDENLHGTLHGFGIVQRFHKRFVNATALTMKHFHIFLPKR
jgi:hypothetical protein